MSDQNWVVSADDQVAELALEHYKFSSERTLRMINLSENTTYLIDDPGTTKKAILRVHRTGYHDPPAIESELTWLTAVREQSEVSTPVVIPSNEGGRVVTVQVNGIDRHAVLFELVPGIEPHGGTIVASDFETLGAITAKLHDHARRWERPDGFTRFSWDWEHSLGGSPRWGRWQDGIDIGDSEREVLGAAAELVHSRLKAYGSGGDRYGLIHADLRLANLLVDGEIVNVIDFDDCGFSWFMYDFGTAVSFMEHDARLPQWQEAWLRGYRTVGQVSAEEEDMLATFVMMRRLLLVAWMGSHSHSQECQELGPQYTADSCELAQRYLASHGLSLS